MKEVFVTNEASCSRCGTPSSRGCNCGQHDHDEQPELNYAGQAGGSYLRNQPVQPLGSPALNVWNFDVNNAAGDELEEHRSGDSVTHSCVVNSGADDEVTPLGGPVFNFEPSPTSKQRATRVTNRRTASGVAPMPVYQYQF